MLGYVHNLTTAREVWISLAENFNKSSLAREFSLRHSLQLLTSKGKTLPAYSREFKTLCDSLSSIGKPVDESLKIFGFLNGLGREYDPIATVIQSSLTKFPQPTFNDVVSEVQGFEAKLKSYEDNTTVTPHFAFATQTSETSQEQKVYAPSYNPNYRGRGRSTYRGRGGYSTRGRGFVQHQSPSNSSGERPVCQICGRTGHTALKCYNRFDNNYQSPTAYTLVRHNDGRSQEWFPDSGASAHVTASFQNLQTTHPYEGGDAVMVGDGAFLPITHVGSSAITTTSGNITLNDVLVCPDIKKSMLSVSKLCEDYPCGVFFDVNHVYVIDIPNQRVIAKGSRSNGLYQLKSNEVVVFFSNRQATASKEVWHSRLGHTNSKTLQHLQSSKAIIINKSNTKSICQPCQMGKSSRLQFSLSTSFVSEPLGCIQCDL